MQAPDELDSMPNRAERRRIERAASKADVGCHSASPQQTLVFEDAYEALVERERTRAVAMAVRGNRGCERRARPRERRAFRRSTRSTGDSGDDPHPGPSPAAAPQLGAVA